MKRSENSENRFVAPAASVRLNVARGLSSLVDQAMEKIAARVPQARTACHGLGDVLRQFIAEHPDVPQEDITAVELARRAGILKPAGRRGLW